MNLAPLLHASSSKQFAQITPTNWCRNPSEFVWIKNPNPRTNQMLLPILRAISTVEIIATSRELVQVSTVFSLGLSSANHSFTLCTYYTYYTYSEELRQCSVIAPPANRIALQEHEISIPSLLPTRQVGFAPTTTNFPSFWKFRFNS